MTRVSELYTQIDDDVYLQVIVAVTGGDLSEAAVEQAGVLGKLAGMQILREQRIKACPGHEWEFEFPAVYLDGAADALCRCGARRSAVTPA